MRTYDTETGAYKGSLYAGPEVAQVAGAVDTHLGISAFVLPTKEHIIFREEMQLGKVLMYRYTPN
ncbi:hypothetical protein LVJ94_09610 [Pendulispora rubella]|uniref:Uncharacterized protein n=1 Tax=Pendulispora rubella TaxID=2741070 RepID=A0ABZ2L982_9BACT